MSTKEEDLKVIRRNTTVIAFVCWPIAIAMVLGTIGLIIKGLIVICGIMSVHFNGNVVSAIVGIGGAILLVLYCAYAINKADNYYEDKGNRRNNEPFIR